jgi:hypothetical protein
MQEYCPYCGTIREFKKVRVQWIPLSILSLAMGIGGFTGTSTLAVNLIMGVGGFALTGYLIYRGVKSGTNGGFKTRLECTICKKELV